MVERSSCGKKPGEDIAFASARHPSSAMLENGRDETLPDKDSVQ